MHVFNKRILVIFLAFLLSPVVKAQKDSLTVDSVVVRINALLKSYRSKEVKIDTTAYVISGYDANDFNLLVAASMGACDDIVLLFAKGADVNNMADRTARPLHYAVVSGSKEAAEILLLLGADVDKFDAYGNTPLISAVRGNNLEIAELLIRYGASVAQADRSGSTPLHHAVALGYFYLADMLLYYDAPLEPRDIEGNTPLIIGVSFGYYDVCDLLLQNGADPNVSDKKGFTPLMIAAQEGDTLMMRLLTDAGAWLYAFNKDGVDALGCAVRTGKTDAVKFLLERGKRWSYQGIGQKHPVTIAGLYNRKNIIPVLNEYGLSKPEAFSLEELTATTGIMLTGHYFMLKGSVELADPEMRAGIRATVATNPFNYQLLVEGEGNVIYQYRVNTSVISAGIFKSFTLSQSASDNRITLVPSLAGGYRFFSKYTGTNDKPGDGFCFMPSAEVMWRRRNISLTMGLAFFSTPYYKVSPLWFNIGISYTLSRESRGVAGKKIRLYNYEQN